MLLWLILTATVAAQPLNILIYHHIADDTPHSTSTREAQFYAQLDHFEQQGYQIVALDRALEALQAGESLPAKSLALTFDDGFASVCDRVYPELKRRNLPFTVFVTTDPIDNNYPGYCSWAQLKAMAENGVTIANHTTDHAYLVRQALDDPQWLSQAQNNITRAQQRIDDEIGYAPKLFAYPYGEYNLELKQWLNAQGYIAFGQQSGSIGKHSDWQALPRFNASGHYAGITSLRHKISAHPLAVDYAQLPDPLTRKRRPSMTLTLDPSSVAHYPHLQCYLNGTAIEVEWHSSHSLTVTPPDALSTGRHRVNCTAPHRQGSPYYWLSQQWLIVD